MEAHAILSGVEDCAALKRCVPQTWCITPSKFVLYACVCVSVESSSFSICAKPANNNFRSMNNFLCLCFLCPLSCYFFPPGFLPFLMQISPLRLPHLSLFYVPPLSLVIITEYCSELCFGVCHDNILRFVLEKREKEKWSETKCWVRNVWSNEAVFWSGASHVTEKSTEFTLWWWLDQLWCGWFRHMFVFVLVAEYAGDKGMFLGNTKKSRTYGTTRSDISC